VRLPSQNPNTFSVPNHKKAGCSRAPFLVRLQQKDKRVIGPLIPPISLDGTDGMEHVNGEGLLMARINRQRPPRKASIGGSGAAHNHVLDVAPLLRRTAAREPLCLAPGKTPGLCPLLSKPRLDMSSSVHSMKMPPQTREFRPALAAAGPVTARSQARWQPTQQSEKEGTTLSITPARSHSGLSDLSRTLSFPDVADHPWFRQVYRISQTEQEKAICSALPLFVRFRQRRQTETTQKTCSVWAHTHTRWVLMINGETYVA